MFLFLISIYREGMYIIDSLKAWFLLEGDCLLGLDEEILGLFHGLGGFGCGLGEGGGGLGFGQVGFEVSGVFVWHFVEEPAEDEEEFIEATHAVPGGRKKKRSGWCCWLY